MLETVKEFTQKTYDGWKNIVTGLNIKNRDKKVSSVAEWFPVTRSMVEDIYGADDMAAKIVDAPAQDMVREWFKISTDFEDQKLNEKIMNKLDDLDAKAKVQTALTFARLYGGSAIIIGAKDGTTNPSLPLNINNLFDIEFLTVVDRFELYPLTIQGDPRKKHYGEPETYQLVPVSAQGQQGEAYQSIHRSRIIRFDGAFLPTNLKIKNQYWGDSVLNRLEGALRNFHTAHDSLATILSEFAIGVFKMKNLSQMIAQGKDELVQKRLELVAYKQSVVNAIVIQDDEEFEKKQTPITGIPEALDRVDKRLTSASGLPHTILLGESPSGLGATGNSEIRDYYDMISRMQESQLQPQMLYLLDLVLRCKAGPTKGLIPNIWSIEFNPLWQMSDKESAEIRKIQAEADQIYIQNQVVDPDEIAESRFGSGKYSTDTKLNMEARKAVTPDLLAAATKALDGIKKTT